MDNAIIAPSRQVTPHLPRWAVVAGAWTAFGLFASAQVFASNALRGTPLPWPTALLLQMPLAGAWGLATPGILWLGRRFPIARSRWPRSVAVHLAISNAWIFLTTIGYAYHAANVLPQVANPAPLLQRAAQLFVVWIFTDGLLYWTVIGIGGFLEFQRRLRERELAASQLETQLAQAELQALKMQLHPHFLFNALHTIGSLVRTGDRENAVRVVAGLGDLLRRMLDGASRQEVPLGQEIAFARAYLEIEQIRFRDRLVVDIQADPEVLEASVPHLILQPLVENAIRHGIGPHLSAGRVTVGAHRVGDHLHLLVRDDGPGIDAGNGAARPGIGLTNARARLTRLYGDDCALQVVNAPGGGLEARVVLPWRAAPVARSTPE